MAKTGKTTRSAPGRDKLLDTARHLFLRRGASHVGINDVTDAAGVAKMTLYNNFPSKEALTLAVYGDMADATLRALKQATDGSATEEERVEAMFDQVGAAAARPDYRGCPFIHASLQEAEPAGPLHSLVQAYKRELRGQILAALAEERSNRSELADQILLLLDGAVTEAYIKGVANPIGMAKRAAVALMRYAG
ncbi:TetR/AcrR family transcriptional regulator [Inquilinus sp.]|jgi:AcrR family transcriptional regulator|uniref:TetR/AcrR family transcriptional regulator n=1 Tax=Inquilinus sp. TaxID=1932117 RepID=UPI0037847B14